jgi:hypothetical protein
VRAAAANSLARDPNSDSGEALINRNHGEELDDTSID